MKRLHADDQTVTFELSPEERAIVVDVLGMYPVVPPAHHAVTRNLDDTRVAEFQHLLDEAVASQRAENKRHLTDWLNAPDRFRTVNDALQLSVKHDDTEWLLQVINDIRVGCWLLLGSPEDNVGVPPSHEPKALRLWVAMQVSGLLQSALL